jgi:hypothetical protein
VVWQEFYGRVLAGGLTCFAINEADGN